MIDHNPKADGIYTIEEIKVKAQAKNMLIKMNDDDQTFEVVGSAWWAKYSSVDTPEKLLACINHLSKKRWITTAHICALLSKLSAHFNYEIENYDAMD